MKACSFEGCLKPHKVRGYCQGHGKQIREERPLKPLIKLSDRDEYGRKHCNRCETWLQVSAFGSNKAMPDWLNNYCRPCTYACRNPELVRAARALRRSRRAGAYRGCWFAREQVITQSYNDPCVFCGQPSKTLEHIDALSTSLDDSADNFAGSCVSCNNRKGVKPLLVFLLDSLPVRSPHVAE